MVWNWIHGGSPPWTHLLGLALGLLVLLPFHVMGWMGAGDVKFFATLGFLLGAKALLPIWIIASLLAGVHAVAILASRYLVRQTPALMGVQLRASGSALWQRVRMARQGREGLPYAAYLAIGALCVVFVPTLQHW